ncbi:hypothetical protein GUITHDRAFT_153758 [Guillardia theta CCMP2712]|uniref:Uncharacterized protein n=1 Tax=Guillardia theta (strain CCMP2712) TaxID=905079 RepID=L1IZX8_GUITC|nr:hypothetical protein GUITHDRAFT_153758 [Guillardia theta CCMP2712]EKX41818.1 hypothetical protein GUITHDRAFT_153758 [Guillardia theta CCMP2712]|eukprot:XP_005828798.1 hypothetical protein GUITHDRAFT_153758 [Guillardia theta CCMP2712]
MKIRRALAASLLSIVVNSGLVASFASSPALARSMSVKAVHACRASSFHGMAAGQSSVLSRRSRSVRLNGVSGSRMVIY